MEGDHGKREGKKKEILNRLINVVCDTIRQLNDGDKASIARIVAIHYEALGYEPKHVNIDQGIVWTKDSGRTYVIKEFDLFNVLEGVEQRLADEIVLDFSAYEGRCVGLPFNLNFVVRHKNG